MPWVLRFFLKVDAAFSQERLRAVSRNVTIIVLIYPPSLPAPLGNRIGRI
jgi:hypothetical protein